jgi:phosphoglycerate kinase
MDSIRLLNSIPDIHGVPVLARLDFNVPVADGRVVDDYRITKALPTIDFLRQRGAKVIIVSHIEGATDTLRPVFEYLKRIMPVTFCADIIKDGPAMIAALPAGEVLLSENIRQYPGEKKNDPEFAKALAALAKLYVNDAFPAAHREHASVVGVPKLLPSYLGLQFEKEVAALTTCFTPAHPFLFILAGAKFETKLPLIQKFLTIADTVFVGGALANDLFKVRGISVGGSLISAGVTADLKPLSVDSKVIIPNDVVVQSLAGVRTLTPGATSSASAGDTITPEESIMDAGPITLEKLATLIADAKHILWNGPLGAYEKGFTGPTKELAKIVAGATGRGAKTIVGGGDTLAAIADLKIESSFSFVSTGGGAMLDFLANGTVPALEALKQ